MVGNLFGSLGKIVAMEKLVEKLLLDLLALLLGGWILGLVEVLTLM